MSDSLQRAVDEVDCKPGTGPPPAKWANKVADTMLQLEQGRPGLPICREAYSACVKFNKSLAIVYQITLSARY